MPLSTDELKERRKNLEDLKTTWRNMGCDVSCQFDGIGTPTSQIVLVY